ncbi:MAG TPA: SRPBCC family protein [Streptosporangiaceae bacterium]|jgi:hypothetical protein
MVDGFLSVSRRIEAPVEQLFALLADSANHPLIDGSGMVREPAPAVKMSGIGDVFMINMYNDQDGDYQVRNVVVEYLADRRLAWAPMTPTSDPEEQHTVDPVRYEWGYELAPDGHGVTVVTETFDCRRAPEDLRKRLQDGETWRDAMIASLIKLELLAKTRVQQ